MASSNKKVRMIARISGTRDGKDWPAPGQEASFPKEEAESLIRSGMAVDPSTTETATATTSGVETATTSGNRSARVTAAEAKAAADKQAADSAAADAQAAELAAKQTEEAAKKSAADAKSDQDAKK